MSTYSESIRQVPLPKDLAGYQLVENGYIKPWDIIVPNGSISNEEWQWADAWIGLSASMALNRGDRVYRKMPCPKQGCDLPDSGERKAFDTGAVRDASKGKGHFHSIPPTALRHLAKRFEDGAAKYAKDNWMKGIALSHYEDSLTRHILAWKEGQTDEDHAGAIIWNACCMVWTDEQIKAGKLPATLDDLPYRK